MGPLNSPQERCNYSNPRINKKLKRYDVFTKRNNRFERGNQMNNTQCIHKFINLNRSKLPIASTPLFYIYSFYALYPVSKSESHHIYIYIFQYGANKPEEEPIATAHVNFEIFIES